MSKEKQIEEMAKVLDECCNRYDENGKFLGNKCSSCEYWCDTNHLCCSYSNKEAEALYNAGYRKQIEGEWYKIDGFPRHHFCKRCGKGYRTKHNFCPNCGARMSVGKNE